MRKNVSDLSKTKNPKGNTAMHAAQSSLPVVGIGASAGGLEALEVFLKNIPSACGVAFVIVQHLDPAHKDMMVELLQRVTPLPVVQVTDRLKIEPNHVYVIPPNKDLTLLHGTLHLLDPVEPRGLRLPVDFFFRSLADDLQQQSIGVILSGMGSDGSLGLLAIKEYGGGIFVQDPSSAKFDGMPRSAIDLCPVDVIAPVEELPGRILAWIYHPHFSAAQALPLEERVLSGLEKVVILLRLHTGQDFSLYKKSTIYRRIERRMGIHQIERIADYVHFLQENPHETELLFKELLIGVTSFFRDPIAWESLKLKVIPSLLASRTIGGVLRGWVAGCSTGEEAYSLAIIFREVIETVKPSRNFRLQIFATDLDKDAIEKARAGLFPLNIVSDVSPERLQRFFERDEHGYRIAREIRETIVFAPQNVIMDPPFTKLDILICRNLLIYIEPELQKKLLPLFHYSLNPEGVLFLGSAESLGSSTNLFKPLDGKIRIFRKLHTGVRPEPLALPFSFSPTLPAFQTVAFTQPTSPLPAINLQALTDQLLLQTYTPAAVLTNDKGDIISISGHTGKYLEPAAGKANWNIFAMAREGLRYELNLMFGSVLHQKGVVNQKGVKIASDGDALTVNLTVELLEKPAALRGLVLIVFTDMASVAADKAQPPLPVADSGGPQYRLLQQELRQALDEILSIREEMQTSQEELKSTNEEMQSANEELQSTNEELTTSREEMQSMNEELQTVNNELQSKVSDLSQANNDMKNLLNSTDIATLFLDDALNIRRFTTRTATIIKLIASDVGRPITDIVTDLHYPALADDASEVLHSLVFSEKEVSASNGRWFTVKIMPYRTQENRIVGLVITITDITSAKKFEEALHESEDRCRFVFQAISAGTLLLDGEGKILLANREVERLSGFSKEVMQGKTSEELRWKIVREDGSDFSFKEHPVFLALPADKPVKDVVVGLFQPGHHCCRWFKIHALPRFRPGVAAPSEVCIKFVETKSFRAHPEACVNQRTPS